MNGDEYKANVKHASLVGFADPTGTIPPDSVYIPGFVTVGAPKSVFITRSPCTEGSDGLVVKVVTSRNETLNRMHFGSVIFPLGTPSLPSRINSSDLDGDRFFVCWHETILNEMRNFSDHTKTYVSRVKKTSDPDDYAKQKCYPVGWESIPNLWFKMVQDCIIGNRYYDIHRLVTTLHLDYGKALKNFGHNHERTLIAGQAWKEANELEKHAGRIEVPLSYYNELAKKFEPLLLPGNEIEGMKMHCELASLKPLFEVGDKVFAPDFNIIHPVNKEYTWYPAVITRYSTVTESEYGEIRKYDVRFDEYNDEGENILDAYIFSWEDYLLHDKTKVKWRGIKNIRDTKSRDDWARKTGWYEAIIGKSLCLLECFITRMANIDVFPFPLSQIEKYTSFLAFMTLCKRMMITRKGPAIKD